MIPQEVTARFEKILAARGEDEMIESLKYWKSTGIAEEGGLITDAEYDVWIKWLEKNGELKEGQMISYNKRSYDTMRRI